MHKLLRITELFCNGGPLFSTILTNETLSANSLRSIHFASCIHLYFSGFGRLFHKKKRNGNTLSWTFLLNSNNSKNITKVSLLLKSKNTDSLVVQTETKAHETLEVNITKSTESFSFDKSLLIEDGDGFVF